MVFPSLTDTFGLVNLEAMACGVPVAAYPVTGPIDVIEDGVTGALDNDLARAATRALLVDPAACRKRALRAGWTPVRANSKAIWPNAARMRSHTGAVAVPWSIVW